MAFLWSRLSALPALVRSKCDIDCTSQIFLAQAFLNPELTQPGAGHAYTLHVTHANTQNVCSQEPGIRETYLHSVGISEPSKDTFRKRLKLARGNMSQRKMAELLQVPFSTYQAWEYGTRFPGSRKLDAVAEMLDLSVEWFFTPLDDKQELLIAASYEEKDSERAVTEGFEIGELQLEAEDLARARAHHQGKHLPDSFPDMLRSSRRTAGLRIGDAAKAAGLSPDLWGQYEDGNSVPDLETLQAIGRVVQKPLASFFLGPVSGPEPLRTPTDMSDRQLMLAILDKLVSQNDRILDQNDRILDMNERLERRLTNIEGKLGISAVHESHPPGYEAARDPILPGDPNVTGPIPRKEPPPNPRRKTKASARKD